MLGKKSSYKSAKKRFLYSHEYHDQKMAGKKRAKQFFRNTRVVRTNILRKNRGKKVRKTFFIFTRISYRKNMVKKKRETIFPEAFE